MALTWWAGAAWGHAALQAVDPAPGAVLQQAPAAIVLKFDQPVGVTILRLFDPQGKEVVLGPIQDSDGTVRIPVPPDAAQGTWLLSWRIVSADGHPVGGTLSYSIAAVSAPAVALSSPAQRARDGAIWLTRWLTYLCLVAAVGAALFRSVYPQQRQDWAWVPVGMGLVLLAPDLALQGLDLRDAPWSALGDPDIWRAALASTYASTLWLDGVALLLAAASLSGRSRVHAAFGPAGAILVGVGAAVSGHVGTALPHWLSRTAVIIHVVMVVTWIGLLVPLMRSLRTTTTAAERAAGVVGAALDPFGPLRFFSRWITPVVLLLAANGVVMALLQLEHWSDFWRTHYGQVLFAKLSLVALLVGVAAINRWHLTRPVFAGAAGARQRLRAAIRIELVLAVLILALVSVWRLTPPPRSLEAGAAVVPAVTLADSRVRVQVNPQPGAWHIRLERPDGSAFAAQAITLVLSNPLAGIEPIRSQGRPVSGSLWQATVPRLPRIGSWRVEVDVLIDDFDRLVVKQASGAQEGAAARHSHGAPAATAGAAE